MAECMLYSNNPEPGYLVLYFDREDESVFRVEFRKDDSNREFEYKYLEVCEKIQKTSEVLWAELDRNKNFRRTLRTCGWIETRKAPVTEENVS